MIPVAHTSHASTIEILPDGSLAAAWFSGEHEEASDLAIVFSVLNGGEWSKPQTNFRARRVCEPKPSFIL